MHRIMPILLFCGCAAVGAAAQTQHLTADTKESTITYYLVHPLHKVESESKALECTIDADKAKHQITAVSARVDVTTFDSGNSNRDSHAMEVIDALTYPEASFTSTKISMNGDSLMVEGRLTFHGVTKPIVIAAKPTWTAGKLDVRGSFAISLTAFKVSRPSLLMVPVEDTLRFAIKAVFGL